MTDDADDPTRRRRYAMPDDERVGRPRTRTPVAGVVTRGEIDNNDTLDGDAPDQADLTPVGSLADRYNDPDLRRLIVDLDRRAAHRLMQHMAASPLGEDDRKRIEGEIDRLRQRQRDVEKHAADAIKAIALHGVEDDGEFKRIDEALVRVEKRHEKGEKSRVGLIGTAVGSLGFAIVALLTAAKSSGAEENAIANLIEKVRDHTQDIDHLRALLMRLLVRNPFMPDIPAPSGDPP